MSKTKAGIIVCVAAASMLMAATTTLAKAPSGAIFTTLPDGSEVNFNIYSSKEDVYLDGGPGPNAPQTAAGLDDGVYLFMVTDPSGKKLLSTDAAQCRQFTVTNGVITGTGAPAGCAHKTGLDVDHGATTVQLLPFNDTPNPGGVYKVWATLASNYVCPLNKVECTVKGAKHGFVPADSKTDNFKVKGTQAHPEIDTRFFSDINGDGHRQDNEPWIDGLSVTWTDPLGGSNVKLSYLDLALNVNHEAHVEQVESGTHFIRIDDQAGCTVGLVHLDNVDQLVGPQTVAVTVPTNVDPNRTYFIDVACS
jgi:hypothetical protein